MTTVTVLTPDVSENCLGRAHLLARLLQPRFQVQVAGPQFGAGVWGPLAHDTSVPILAQPMKVWGPASGLAGWKRLMRRADSDVLYVSKPFGTTLWAARRRQRQGRPTLVDIDDWEPGLLEERRLEQGPLQRAARSALALGSLHHRAPWNTALGERWARGLPARTVSNRFLQTRYGGALVWHARDCDALDPARQDRAAERAALGLGDGDQAVLFLGTARPHKGLEELVEAVARSPPHVRLVVAGLDDGPYPMAFRQQAKQRLGERAILLGVQPFDRMPGLLCAADVVAIPQRASPGSVGQMPAKVFDAMAMAKPVLATAVSDLPEVLAGCGVVVPPGDAGALTAGLAGLLADPDRARALGAQARRRCIESYSHDAMRRVLVPLVEGLL